MYTSLLDSSSRSVASVFKHCSSFIYCGFSAKKSPRLSTCCKFIVVYAVNAGNAMGEKKQPWRFSSKSSNSILSV